MGFTASLILGADIRAAKNLEPELQHELEVTVPTNNLQAIADSLAKQEAELEPKAADTDTTEFVDTNDVPLTEGQIKINLMREARESIISALLPDTPAV